MKVKRTVFFKALKHQYKLNPLFIKGGFLYELVLIVNVITAESLFDGIVKSAYFVGFNAIVYLFSIATYLIHQGQLEERKMFSVIKADLDQFEGSFQISPSKEEDKCT